MILKKLAYQKPNQTYSDSKNKTSFFLLSKLITSFFWLVFIINIVLLASYYPNIPDWRLGNILRINGFTILIWATVTFFSAIVSSYTANYLKGFRYNVRFILLSFAFTLSVILLVASNHLLLLLFSWFAMGCFMSRMIGINAIWAEAREAAKFTQRYFLLGTFLLGIGMLLLALHSRTFTLNDLAFSMSVIPTYILMIASLCIIGAAMVQSAIYPFHRWLLSAMTAPTPASALMHAGFVNGSGIILALFSSLLFASNTLNLLLIIGGLTAIIAQFTKLLQVNVKQKLACSTIAQMGFMIMQCGLGFFNAAVVHLILHGFYKAYLFLASGEEIVYSNPERPIALKITIFQAVIVLFVGFCGALLFLLLTGKGTQLDSSIFLTLIVAITVGQVTYNILKERSLSLFQKFVLPSVLFICGIGLYALMYGLVTPLMADLPLSAQPLPLSIEHIVFGIIFLIGFFIMKLAIYRNSSWLYIKLLNLSQPYKRSILTNK